MKLPSQPNYFMGLQMGVEKMENSGIFGRDKEIALLAEMKDSTEMHIQYVNALSMIMSSFSSYELNTNIYKGVSNL